MLINSGLGWKGLQTCYSNVNWTPQSFVFRPVLSFFPHRPTGAVALVKISNTVCLCVSEISKAGPEQSWTSFYDLVSRQDESTQAISLDHSWPLCPSPAWNSCQFNATKIPKPKMPMPGSSEMPLGEGSHMVPLMVGLGISGQFSDSRCNNGEFFRITCCWNSRDSEEHALKMRFVQITQKRKGCFVWDSNNLDFQRAIYCTNGANRLILVLLLQI